jgi:hypothetical protein
MKVYIVLRQTGFGRHSIDLIRKLVENKHQVHLSVLKLPKKSEGDEGFMFHQIYEEMEKSHDNFQYSLLNSKLFEHFWAPVTSLLRGFIDYFRFFDKNYNDFQGKLLQERSEKLIRGFTLLIAKIVFPRFLMRFIGSGVFTIAQKTISFFDRHLPVAPKLKDKIQKINPDVILVTPMVYFGCPTNEIVKAAHFLGINSGLLVASWDNLTNKGLIKYHPRKVFVWNDFQKKEAIDLHKINAEKIEVMGSPTFDNWFSLKPSIPREQFLENAGLKKDAKYILYLCSSQSIVNNETISIDRWINRMRKSKRDKLNEYSIIIRPHPKQEEIWNDYDISQYKNCTIYPLKRNFSKGFEDAKNSFFDSLYYSEFVVGVNTTSMIEAGILKKPVFTLVPKENSSKMHEGTYGTLHFKYLLDGGLIKFSDNTKHHYDQLLEYIELSEKDREEYLKNIENFIKKFVRPNGLTQNVVELYYQKVMAMSPERMKPLKVNFSHGFSSYIIRALLLPFKFEVKYKAEYHKVVLRLPWQFPQVLNNMITRKPAKKAKKKKVKKLAENT